MAILSNCFLNFIFFILLFASFPDKAAAHRQIMVEDIKGIVQKSIDTTFKTNEFSGTFLVEQGNEVVHIQNFGFADKAIGLPASSTTQYLIGSVTKQFTGAAVLRALYDKSVQDGIPKEDLVYLEKIIKTNLNTSISYYLPEGHPIWAGSMPAWAETVTLHHLLTHSSGIPNFTALPEYESMQDNPPEVSGLVSIVKTKELEFTPGTKFSYSNSGYVLLGEIVCAIAGKPLDVYMKDVFFKPLEMNSTFLATHGTLIDMKKSDARCAKLARGYICDILEQQPVVEEVKKYEPMQLPRGAGSLVSTALDLVKWNNALYEGDAIPEFLVKMMLTPHMQIDDAASYGYGLVVVSSEKLDTFYMHAGGILGFLSDSMYVPSLDLSIVCLSNVMVEWHKVQAETEKIDSELSLIANKDDRAEKLKETIENRYPQISKNKKLYSLSELVHEVMREISNLRASN